MSFIHLTRDVPTVLYRWIRICKTVKQQGFNGLGYAMVTIEPNSAICIINTGNLIHSLKASNMIGSVEIHSSTIGDSRNVWTPCMTVHCLCGVVKSVMDAEVLESLRHVKKTTVDWASWLLWVYGLGQSTMVRRQRIWHILVARWCRMVASRSPRFVALWAMKAGVGGQICRTVRIEEVGGAKRC